MNYNSSVGYGAAMLAAGHNVVPSGSAVGRTFYCVKAADPFYDTISDIVKVDPDGDVRLFSSLTNAMAACKHHDTILLGGGDWTGNYTTPANTVARNVSIIALNAATHGVSGKAWAGATTSTSPIFTIQARGWRISGIEFVPGSTSSAITLSGTNANYFQVDNCSTFTGKYFLLNGGTHFVKVLNNQIVRLNAAGSIGIGALTGIGGQYWEIRGNLFSDNYSHINFGNTGDRGLFSSLIKDNVFIRGGAWTISTTLIDNRSTSDTGGTAIVGNYFDCTLSVYASGAGAMIRTQARDWGAGNWCNDGIPIAAIEH